MLPASAKIPLALPSPDDEENDAEPVSTQSSAALPDGWRYTVEGDLRGGPQPKDEYPFVRTAPLQQAKGILYRAAGRNVSGTDAGLPGADLKELTQRTSDIKSDLWEKYPIPHKEGHAGIVCDFTGLPMSWAPGPLHATIEAFYPFALVNGQFQYHGRANIGMTTASVNWLKGGLPIISLPVFAVLLRAHQEPTFEAMKATMSWGYIAMENIANSARAFHLGNTRMRQTEMWTEWDAATREAVLETWRTGRPMSTQIIRDALTQWEQRRRGYPAWLGLPMTESGAEVSWTAVDKNLRKIAEHYGLTTEEFDHCCTICAPSLSCPTRRVFYPYHILSRPQAEDFSWDWDMLYSVAAGSLKRMGESCNKTAEGAGLGEKAMDPERFIYARCHVLCRQIQGLKTKWPTATLDELAFRILDRWGLPLAPWAFNPLKASVCKFDHGIAMRYGLQIPPGEKFDAVRHFNMDSCTVVFDTWGTNKAMLNHPMSSWDGIYERLLAVPLGHPLWKIDPALGITSWTGQWHTRMAPQAPVPAVQIPLLPIGPWLDGGPPRQHMPCHHCPGAEFPTIGLLLRHYLDCHGRRNGTANHYVPDPAQDRMDKEFWITQTTCNWEGCGMTFSRFDHLQSHVKIVHEKQAVTTFKCDREGCGETFTWKDALRKHILNVHEQLRPFKCEHRGCGETFPLEDSLQLHIRDVHGKPKAFKCEHEGCGEAFARKTNLQAHIQNVHQPHIRPFECEHKGCGKAFKRKADLRKHILNVHEKLKPFKCEHEGCGKGFPDKGGLDRHVRAMHMKLE